MLACIHVGAWGLGCYIELICLCGFFLIPTKALINVSWKWISVEIQWFNFCVLILFYNRLESAELLRQGGGFLCKEEVIGIPSWATFVILFQYELCHLRSDAGSEETSVCFLFPVCDVIKNASSSSEPIELLALQEPKRCFWGSGFLCLRVSVCNLSFHHIRINPSMCTYGEVRSGSV